MNKRLKTYLIAAGVLVVVFGFVYLFIPGQVSLQLASSDLAKAGAVVTTDQDHFKVAQPLPVTLRLRAGHHRLVIAPTNKLASLVEENIFVWPSGSQNLNINLDQGDLPGARGAAANPYLNLLPHNTGDYRLEGQFSADLTSLVGINLTVLHRFADPSNPVTYQAEHDNAVTEAKAYLNDSKIPATIPLTITDL